MPEPLNRFPSERWAAIAEDANRLKEELIRLIGKRVIWRAHNDSLRGQDVQDSTSVVHEWLRENYFDSMIVGLRRVLDQTGGVLSLPKLLARIALAPQEFTFERF